ncbi:MAG: NADH-quinone oxidoreductase subunit NuoH [Candidatus Neomarinimicrobiota bacterium]|nr:MAG: NADH-quinone oxidoreductase subunit NuoH [Candidatus Neomarinimicrobiota bacterium]
MTGLPLFLVLATNAIVAVYVERKVSAFMQDRIGPMGQGAGFHAGKWGLLQTVADALKLLLKEDVIPSAADRKLFVLAPYIIFLAPFLAIAAIPFNQVLQVSDLNIGVFYVLAMGSFGVIGLILAGWASDNKWSLYGAMRSAAQIVSYEIPAGLSIIAVVMLVGSLNLQQIIEFQTGTRWGFLPNWVVFHNPFSFLAFFIYFISSVAEVNRTPFDIPEAESELVAGFHTEYSGMRWALFFLSEYANMLIVTAVAVIVFLGGWTSPIPGLFATAGWGLFWFLFKIGILILVMMWFRWTFPRLRVDQLMHVCWKVFIPLAMLNIFGVGVWALGVG